MQTSWAEAKNLFLQDLDFYSLPQVLNIVHTDQLFLSDLDLDPATLNLIQEAGDIQDAQHLKTRSQEEDHHCSFGFPQRYYKIVLEQLKEQKYVSQILTTSLFQCKKPRKGKN